MMTTNLLLLPKAYAGLGEQGCSLWAGQHHLLPVGASDVHLDTAASNAVFGFGCIFLSILIIAKTFFTMKSYKIIHLEWMIIIYLRGSNMLRGSIVEKTQARLQIGSVLQSHEILVI